MSIRRNFLTTLIVSGTTVLIAAGRNVVFGNVFGATAETDAFCAAQLWFRLFLEDLPSLLLPSILPVYMVSLQSGSASNMRRTLGRLMLAAAPQFLITLVLLAAAAPWLIAWTVSRQYGSFELAERMFLSCLSLGPLLFIACFFRAHLEARRRFAESTMFRGIVWTVSLAAFATAPWLGVWAAMLGLAVGTLLALMIVGLIVRNDLRSFAPTADDRSPAQIRHADDVTSTMSRATGTLLATLILQRAAGLLDLHFGSMIEPGAVTIYSLAGAAISLPVVLLAQTVSTVVSPRTAELRAKSDRRSLATAFAKLAAVIISGGIIAASIVYLGADWFARILFAHGAFTPDEIEQTATVLRVFSGSIIPLCIQYGCMSFAVSVTPPLFLAGLAAFTLTVRYAFLTYLANAITLPILVASHILYHSLWAVGLSACILLYIRPWNITEIDPMTVTAGFDDAS